MHFDLPWSPVRLDQRNGRAYRIGQKRAQVRAVYFIPESRETRIAETIARKNRVRRRMLDAVHSSRGAVPQPTLRPRLTGPSAFVHLVEAFGSDVPEVLERCHKAGLERLLRDLGAGAADRQRLNDIAAILSARGASRRRSSQGSA